MKLFALSLPRPLNKHLRVLAIILLLLGAVGFADSLYLVIEHLRGIVPPCTLVTGCEDVLTSKYAAIAFVPVPFIGVLFYFGVLFASFWTLESDKTTLLPWLFMFSIAGMTGTLWFLFVQAVLLQAFCFYCLISATTSTLIFVGSLYGWKLLRTMEV